MIQTIKFTDVVGVEKKYYPVPSSKLMPDWYKNLESYVGGKKEISYLTVDGKKRQDGSARTTATAKRCMPIFDAINSGYIIFTYTDLLISQRIFKNDELQPHYDWTNFNPISFHPKQQLPSHPDGSGHKFAYPKWNNVWSITTPPGYSCLFVSPLHRETPISILPGVVDTDTFSAPVNFPFVLRDPKMEGLIPAGTPIAQVIPFKRDEFKMEIGDIKEYEQQAIVSDKLRTVFFDSYKNQFRQHKEYR